MAFKQFVSQSRSRLRFETVTAAAVFCLLGLLGNYVHVSLFFGVDFLFGGVAVMLAMSLLGWGAGCVVGAIASTYTYLLWGHPYAILIFTLEAIVVGYLSQRRRWNLTSSEAAYWFTVGIPLVYYCYHVRLEMLDLSAWTIALKQASNGLFCAFVVSALLLLPAVRTWTAPGSRVRTRRLKDIVVELSIAFTFFALLLSSALDSNIAHRQAEREVYLQLQSIAQNTIAQVRAWETWDGNNTELLNDLIRTQDYPLDLTLVLESERLNVRIEHSNGKSADPIPEFSHVRYVFEGLDQYFPAGKMNIMRRWRQSVYQWDVPATADSYWSLKILTCASPLIDRLELLYSQQLLRLLVITGFVLALSHTVMTALNRPLRLLDRGRSWQSASATVGTTAAIADGSADSIGSTGAGSWRLTSSAEIEPLISSGILEFRVMGRYLRQMFEGRNTTFHQLERDNYELQRALQTADAVRIDQGAEAAHLKQALLENHQRLSAVLRYSPIAALEWQPGGTISAWNPGAYARFGYMESEIVGCSLFETILPASECAVLLEHASAKGETMEPFRSTHMTLAKDGSEMPVDWFSRPIVSQSGQLIAMMSVLIEATDIRPLPQRRASIAPREFSSRETR